MSYTGLKIGGYGCEISVAVRRVRRVSSRARLRLRSYWQEAGRAGRDGVTPATCIVFVRGADLCRLSCFVADSPSRAVQLKRLYAGFRLLLSPAWGPRWLIPFTI